MRPTRYRRHSTKFKLELVRAYLNGEGGYKTIARKHDISLVLLMIWVEKYQRGDLTEEIEDEENSREYEVKIAALERKIGQLVMELDLLKKKSDISQRRAAVDRLRSAGCSVREGCGYMNISPSTYYKKADKDRQTLQRQSDTALLKSIEKVLSDWPCYGYRRVTAELRRRGIIVNHKRVARIMREQQLTVKPRSQKHQARPEECGAPCPNLAKGFIPDGPNRLWVGDLTYIRLLCGFVYLAVLIDAWSRRVVGYAVSQSMDVRLTLSALNAAVHDRNPGADLIHHSDRGSQYLAKVYQNRLMDLGIRGSMSRPGTPTDNPKAESFMKTLKYEEISASLGYRLQQQTGVD